jgi:nucleotide-binding universal stress UspA family protein
MSVFHSILYATDFSSSAVPAYQVACALASQNRCRLVIVHVLEAPVTAFVGGALIPEPASLTREIQLQLERMRPDDPTVVVEPRLVEGEAAEQIVRLAGERNCDLIVLGTHGRTGLKRLVLGSVAEKVVRTASCPVLTVRAPGANPLPAV